MMFYRLRSCICFSNSICLSEELNKKRYVMVNLFTRQIHNENAILLVCYRGIASSIKNEIKHPAEAPISNLHTVVYVN